MKPKMPSISVERIKELWNYDPKTGIFRWKVHASRKFRAGSVAGETDPSRYVRLRYREHFLYAHRVAWAISFGVWPPDDIDHIDMNKNNNRLSNLRLATRAQNIIHRPVRKNSLTRVKGVYQDKRDGRFYAYIDVMRKRHNLGGFAALADANKARIEAETTYHGEFSFRRS